MSAYILPCSLRKSSSSTPARILRVLEPDTALGNGEAMMRFFDSVGEQSQGQAILSRLTHGPPIPLLVQLCYKVAQSCTNFVLISNRYLKTAYPSRKALSSSAFRFSLFLFPPSFLSAYHTCQMAPTGSKQQSKTTI